MNQPLTQALAIAQPAAEQTLLLRACLWEGEDARAAWEEYRRHGPRVIDLLRRDAVDVRRLAPMLFLALRRLGEPDRELLTVLRAAYTREQLRSREYRRVCGAILGEMHAVGIRFVVFRGAALGEVTYRDAALRHSHDVNLLLPEGDGAMPALALAERGFARRAGRWPDAVILDHSSGMPVLLHCHPLRITFYPYDREELWARGQPGRVAGHEVRLLGTADALLNACCQAFVRPTQHTLVWACDGYQLIRRHPELDWRALLDVAATTRTELPLSFGLQYLARELRAAVPEGTLKELAGAAANVPAAERDVAFLALRQRGGVGVRGVLRGVTGWRTRLIRLRWLLLPSPEYLRWAFPVRSSAVLPFWYAARLLAFVRRAAAARLKRASSGTRSGVARALS